MLTEFTRLLITFSLVVFVSLIVVSILVLSNDYKYYKLTYEALKNGKYVFNYEYGNLVHFKRPEDPNNIYTYDEIVFFEDNSIKLLGKGSHYIHNQFYSWINPYTMYYHRKIMKWFNENKHTFVNQ